jgi:hypothetical protein
MNYGSGVLGTIPFKAFITAAIITGTPHSLLLILIAKEIGKI